MLLEKLSTFNALDLVVLILATYRLSILLANDWEVGPASLLAKLRERAGLVYTPSGDPVKQPGSFVDGLMCEYCNSLWIGFIFTIVYMLLLAVGWPASLLFLPLALSGASVLIVEAASRLAR